MREIQLARWAEIKGQSKRAPAPAAKPKRKLSAAARATLATNLKKARAALAAKVAATKKAASAPAQKPKRKISPEGMKKIIAANKKMWAARRAAAKAA